MRLSRPGPVAGRPLEEADLPDPVPGRGELLLEVAACGVCRTDLQLAEGDLAAHGLPIVPGHQIVGRVAALGPGTSGWAVGDRAGGGWLAGAGGKGAWWRTGRGNLCEQGLFTRWGRGGGRGG